MVTIIFYTLCEIIFCSCMAIWGVFTICDELEFILFSACELWTFSVSVITPELQSFWSSLFEISLLIFVTYFNLVVLC